jgi:predicted 3-demethylubiquinone-9 3-methyltransferase (glyoxalase superfamily)
MAEISKIVPCLWFDSCAEDAASFYVTLFPGSGIDTVVRYGSEGVEHHGKPAGTVMTVAFHLGAQHFTALNGGPRFTFSEAVSFQVMCDDQGEIDRLWEALTRDGGKESRCGWLKDRFGLSWQIVPRAIATMMSDPDPARVARVMEAFLPMTKLDLPTIERAYRGA